MCLIVINGIVIKLCTCVVIHPCQIVSDTNYVNWSVLKYGTHDPF